MTHLLWEKHDAHAGNKWDSSGLWANVRGCPDVFTVVGAIGHAQPSGEQPDKRRSLDSCKDILELILYSLSQHNPAPS